MLPKKMRQICDAFLPTTFFKNRSTLFRKEGQTKNLSVPTSTVCVRARVRACAHVCARMCCVCACTRHCVKILRCWRGGTLVRYQLTAKLQSSGGRQLGRCGTPPGHGPQEDGQQDGGRG